MSKSGIPQYVHHSLSIIVLAFFLAACSSNKPYRSNLDVREYNGTGSCSDSALQVHSRNKAVEYHLGFV